MSKDSDKGGKGPKSGRLVESTDERKIERNSETGSRTAVRNILKPPRKPKPDTDEKSK